MSIPYFYIPQIFRVDEDILLPEETSKHVVQVLRMDKGETIRLTDGEGGYCTVTITEPHKKKCRVKVLDAVYIQRTPLNRVIIAMSPLKNSSRFEWFLEKATEIGVDEIVPVICHRTEKQHLRMDRLKSILVSAMLQSQQIWLPVLREPVAYKTFVSSVTRGERWIAYCDDAENKSSLAGQKLIGEGTILIGPEGDFTGEEVELAIDKGFRPVSLGDTRLRTETAGVVAATLLRISNTY